MAIGPLKVFVAMPGSDMGPHARYVDPESVKANLLRPAAEKIGQRMNRKVELVIEKDKRSSGVIHESMFREAREADVYIADLTGANPNVYLELGVRWAVKDGVTVLICQRVADLKFNVVANRAIEYGPDTIIKAIEDITEAVVHGLTQVGSGVADNPVRLNANLVTVEHAYLLGIKKEIEELKSARGQDLILAASTTSDDMERIRLLEKATQLEPAPGDSWVKLGVAYRNVRNYQSALDSLLTACRHQPADAAAHRELGVTYSKMNNPARAADHLKKAVLLSPADKEAWSNLGGAMRRLALVNGVDSVDRSSLQASRDAYARAHSIDSHDVYAGVNVCRLDLMLSKWQHGLASEARSQFGRMALLSGYEVSQAPGDFWLYFDLADSRLFSGDFKGARADYGLAIEAVPQSRRSDVFASVASPLRDLLALDVVTKSEKEVIQFVLGLLAVPA